MGNKLEEHTPSQLPVDWMKGVKFAVKDGGTGVKGNQPGAVGIIHAGEDEGLDQAADTFISGDRHTEK